MTRAQIEQLEAARRTAMLKGDVTKLQPLLEPGMTWIHASSKVDDKSSFLQSFAAGTLQCFELNHLETDISIHGPIALVTGIVAMDVTVNGERRTAVNRYSCLWKAQGERIQLLMWQSTRIPSAA